MKRFATIGVIGLIAMALSVGVARLSGLPFWASFAIVTGSILVNGLIATIEDDLPGGFDNPRGDDTPAYIGRISSVADWVLRGVLWLFAASCVGMGVTAIDRDRSSVIGQPSRLATLALFALCAIFYSAFTFNRKQLYWCKWLSLLAGGSAIAFLMWGNG